MSIGKYSRITLLASVKTFRQEHAVYFITFICLSKASIFIKL